MNKKERRLLWVDDDPRDRFIYEEEILTYKDNWRIDWAGTVQEGMEVLSFNIKYQAIIIDQMLPLCSNFGPPEIWGGCYLLHWLRNGCNLKNEYILSRQIVPNPIHKEYSPFDRNKYLPVLMLSAFHDETVLKETKRASQTDKEIIFLSKPVDIDELRRHLNGF